jgi:hypothetical protein
MKYMFMLYENPNARELATPEHVERMVGFVRELKASGELLATEAYAAPATARTVRFPNSAPTTSDGPYAEVKEVMGGFVLLECASFERAMQIAHAWPSDGLTAAIEVRPIVDMER